MSLFCGHVKIKENIEIVPGIYHMVLNCPEVAEDAAPGQFIHIRCTDALSPLLRRPISIAMADKKAGTVEVIYRVVGQGTRLLAGKKKGQMLDIMGPLGHGFPIPPWVKHPVIVGGGIGTAPLLFLAESIREHKLSSAGSPELSGCEDIIKTGNCCGKPAKEFIGTVFVGFLTEKEIFGAELLKDCGFKVEICTDDGSRGYKGFPTDLLEMYLKDGPSPSSGKVSPAIDIIYACGPGPLLSKVASMASRAKIPAYVSLEERMACGVGACLGCAVKSAGGGYMKVCKDGPVFEASQWTV